MKKYVIINNINAEANNIDWSTVTQDGPDQNLMDFLFTRMVVSYEGEMPPTIERIQDKSQEYTKEEMVYLMSQPDWAIYIELCEEDCCEYDDHLKFYEDIL